MKFTFRTYKGEGKWKWLYEPTHYIKLKKNEVGRIDNAPPHKIRLRVIKKDINEDGNKNCEWKWIKLKQESKSIQDAKDWLNEKIEVILNQYKFPND